MTGRHARFLVTAGLTLVAVIVAAVASPGDYRAIDGDTLEIKATGERVRILGIDAPELHPCRCAAECELGTKAKTWLQDRLDTGRVAIDRTGQDRYGRTLAHVLIDGRDVGPDMIAAGLGRAYAGARRLPWCP